MKLVVKEHINAIAEVTQKVYTIYIDALERYGSIAEGIGLAKGDLIAYRGSGDPVRLPVGSSGKVLTADPTQPTGLRWGDPQTSLSGTVTLKNVSGAQIVAGTVVALLSSTERGVIKAPGYCGEKLFIAAEDANNNADIVCYHLPGTVCEVLVTGTANYGDALIVSSTAGVAQAVSSGTPTVGTAMEAKAGSSTAKMLVMLVENKALGITNNDSSSHSEGTLYTFSGGATQDSNGYKCPKVEAATFPQIPCGIQAQGTLAASAKGLIHCKPGEIVLATADDTRIDAGDWLVASSKTAGQVRSGVGPGIGYALEYKASGSAGKVRTLIRPDASGKGFKRYLYFQGNMMSESWNNNLTFRFRNSTTEYSMSKLTNDGSTLHGRITGTGTEDVGLYVRSSAIDVTDYTNLILRIGYITNASFGSNSTVQKIYFGLARKNCTTADYDTITTDLFTSIYDTITPVASRSSYGYTEYAFNVSAASGEYNILVMYAQNDLTGALQLGVQYAYFL